MLWRHANCSTI